MIFDACFISLNDIRSDARTLNFARTMTKYGKTVAIIAHGNEQDKRALHNEGIEFLYINKISSPRAYQKWMHFAYAAKKYKRAARALTYWAEDVYSLIVGRQLAKIHRGKLIYDSREIYSALGPLYENPLKQKILAEYEKRMIEYVDDVIVTGELDRDYLEDYFSKKLDYHIIMNLPPYTECLKSNIIRQKYKIADSKCILIYQGMLLPGRGLLPIIRALPFYEDAILFILGEGPHEEALISQAEALNVMDRVIFGGVVPYDQLHNYTASADIGLVLIEPISFSYRLALPNKLFEYCMACIPSLASNLPAMEKIIAQDKIGKIAAYDESPEKIALALRILFREREKYHENCRIAAKKYSWESQENDILEILV